MWSRNGKLCEYLKVTGSLFRSQWLWRSYLSDIPCKKSKHAPLQERKMIDQFRVWAKGGDGGNGCISIRRSRHDRHGTPDGGNGGRGGDVILECSTSIWDLGGLQHHINAKRGRNGAPKNMIGSQGDDKVVQVPVGTVLHLVEGKLPCAVEKRSSEDLNPWEIPGSLDTDSFESCGQTVTKLLNPINGGCLSDFPSRTDDGASPSINNSTAVNKTSESCREGSCSAVEAEVSGDVTSEMEDEQELEPTSDLQYNVAELTEPGNRITVACGGDGGLGNVSLARGPKKTRRDANVVAGDDDDDENGSLRIGLPGSEVVLVLELKSIADVGLVGMPNAGKSTLLGAISRARPVVGDYAFTTLRPNLGNVRYDDFSITVADIPGLIRGAHDNRGLGHAFLRHIERTKVVAYVLDLAAASDGRKGLPPWEQLKDLVLELELYRRGLSSRPSLVVANKIDEVGAEEAYEELKQRVCGVPIFPVCSVLGEGVPELKDGLRKLVRGGEWHTGFSVDDIRID